MNRELKLLLNIKNDKKMKNLVVKICLTTILMLCATITSFAQSNGDKLFMEGQQLQQIQTIVSQNQAIKKFQSAKVVYTTADKKKMCDNQIVICNNNITSLKQGGKKKGKANQDSAPTEKASSFSLNQDKVEFDGDKPGSAVVNVQATSLDWTFNISEGIDGEMNFIEATRSNDAKSLEISVNANPFTIMRTQTINVTHESTSKKITIKQQGKSVKLSTSTNLVEFGIKGGSKTIEVYTNSDSIISSNNNLTWSVESKPDWLEVNVEVKKKKSIVGRGLSAIKGLVESKAEAASDDDIKKSDVKIVAVPLIKSDKEYLTGRRGEVIFASQDKKYKVIVVQQN